MLSKQAILLLLIWCQAISSNCEQYFIVPSQESPQPECFDCLSVDDLASSFYQQVIRENINVTFLPGNHILTKVIQIQNVQSVLITSVDQNTTLEIADTGSMQLSMIDQLTIEGMKFIGSNTGSLNTKAAIQEFIIDNVSIVYILNCHFTNFNLPGQNGIIVNTLTTTLLMIGNTFAHNNATALYTEAQRVLIENCNFSKNAYGAVQVFSSLITQVIDTNFDSNSALRGGAVQILSENTNITNCKFINNRAQLMGGAIYSGLGDMTISNCQIRNNNCDENGGGIYAQSGDITIHNSELIYNSANYQGGAIYTFTESTRVFYFGSNGFRLGGPGAINVYLINSELSHNQAGRNDGTVNTQTLINLVGNIVMSTNKSIYLANSYHANLHLSTINSKFVKNSVKLDSVPSHDTLSIYRDPSSGTVTITHCEIKENSAVAVNVFGGNITVTNSVLTKNKGGIYMGHCNGQSSVTDSEISNNNQGAIYMYMYLVGVIIVLTNCSFNNNNYILLSPTQNIALFHSPVIISHCIFDNNNGGIWTRTNITIENSTLSNNIGGALTISGGSTNISNSIFLNNALNISTNTKLSPTFLSSPAASIFAFVGNLEIINSTFSNNSAPNGANIYVHGGSLRFRNMNTIKNNIGNIHVSNNKLEFTGPTLLENNSNEFGGAIRAEESEVYLNSPDGIVITNNRATTGGGLSLTSSSLFIHNPLTISHNSAQYGGGIYAQSSRLELQAEPNSRLDLQTLQITLFTYKTSEPNVLISENSAEEGGGIFASASTIDILHIYLSLDSNNATQNGGGMYLQQNTKVQLLNAVPSFNKFDLYVLVTLFNNTAQYGGGIFVNDYTEGKTACGSETTTTQESHCFLQTIDRFSFSFPHNFPINFFTQILDFYPIQINHIFLNDNSAVRGADIYGGLLDRCTVHSAANHPNASTTTGLNYILDTVATDLAINPLISEVYKYDLNRYKYEKNLSIASDPMHVKLCSSTEIQARKGDGFTIAVKVLDQVGNLVNATIRSSVVTESGVGRLKEGQTEQTINGECGLLEYNVFSQDNFARVELFAEGPCSNLGISNQYFDLSFLPCVCPVGLQPTQSLIECICECDTALKQHQITTCSHDNGTVQVETQIWVGIIDKSTGTGFVISDCPFDYCVDEKPIEISLSSSYEIDQQCAFNRSGILCGQCLKGLSLMLASSKCQECSNIYLLLIIPFSLAGVLLALLILVFNLTVATGSIHGLIFYANILAANRSIFFPFQNFLTVFISWVNLDLGIETCFYDGMSSQAKVLLQLAFPAYLFLLIFIIIILSKYFDLFAKLLSNRNPVAALGTLILLSYSKLLRFIIAALQYTILEYPDATSDTVWLIDPNVLYFTPEHTPRFIASAVIITFGGLFTLLLFFGQWIPRLSKWKFMAWTKNSKYNGFMDTFHAPFNPKHRYWVGLLLFALIAQNLISALALNVFLPVFSAGSLAVGLIAYKSILYPVYNIWLNHLLETMFFLNLSLLSYGSFYVGLSSGNQYILANFSLAMAFVLFIFVLCYHCYKYILKKTVTPALRNYNNAFKLKERNPQAQKRKDKNKVEDEEKWEDNNIIHVTDLKTDPDRYITPPIVRPALRPDQLREPALDDLAPITTGDYQQTPPPIQQPAPENHPHVTYAVIEITK